MTNKKCVILVHGIFTRDNSTKNIDRISPAFKENGYDIRVARVGFSSIFGTTIAFANLIESTRRAIDRAMRAGYKKIVCVGHSNGCALLHMASYKVNPELAKHVKLKYIYINAALNERFHPAACVDYLDVYYAPDDWIVWMSQALGWVIPWGKMGKVGYNGPPFPTCSVKNYDMQLLPLLDPEGNPINLKRLGHNDIFDKPQPVLAFSKAIAKNADSHFS